MRVRVICCGNPFRGNDAAGLCVIPCIRRCCPDADVVDGGTGGLGLVPLFEECEGVIIVDATSGLGRIGDVRVYRDAIPAWDAPGASFHDIGIAEAVAVAGAIGIAPRVVLVGIEGGTQMPLSDTMDPAVEQAIRPACAEVLRILADWGVRCDRLL
jgi:hydrogenase maturation protease